MKNKFLLLFLLAFVVNSVHSQTWSDDIACIVYTHCSKCHSPGNIAPFSLMNY